MIDPNTVYNEADFTSEDGILAICEKIQVMDVSENLFFHLARNIIFFPELG